MAGPGPWSTAETFRAATSQSRTRPSIPHEASVLPSGEKASAITVLEWPGMLGVSFTKEASWPTTSPLVRAGSPG